MAYYFASDTHVGLTLNGSVIDSERKLIEWLERVETDAEGIFLVGDIFDFWFEYKRVIPKGHFKLLAKITEITERGIPVHFFVGNHDMWVGDYFAKYCGMTVHYGGEIFELNGKKLYIVHGDGIAVKDIRVKGLQKIFRSKCAKKVFSTLVHPDCAIKFGKWWSTSSRENKNIKHIFQDENEPVIKFARDMLSKQHIDYFVFGHFHCPTKYNLSDNSKLFILGEWINNPKPIYGVLSEDKFTLET